MSRPAIEPQPKPGTRSGNDTGKPEAERAVVMGSDTSGEATARDPSGPSTEGVAAALIDGWIALDRGWQALCLGLAIVGIHLLWQAV